MAQTPPTLISYTEPAGEWTAGSGGTWTSPSISWQTGDVIIVIGGASSIVTFGTPTATGLTFTIRASNNPGSGSTCPSFVATAVAASSSSAAVSVTVTNGSTHSGIAIWVWRGSDGFGNTIEQHTATHSINMTPAGGADSAVCWGVFDFAAGSLGTITPTPTNTRERAVDGTSYTYYVADLIDQTGAGAVAYGLTGSGGGPFSVIGIEVKGAAATVNLEVGPLTQGPSNSGMVGQSWL